jgi:hypothetical protein
VPLWMQIVVGVLASLVVLAAVSAAAIRPIRKQKSWLAPPSGRSHHHDHLGPMSDD